MVLIRKFYVFYEVRRVDVSRVDSRGDGNLNGAIVIGFVCAKYSLAHTDTDELMHLVIFHLFADDGVVAFIQTFAASNLYSAFVSC